MSRADVWAVSVCLEDVFWSLNGLLFLPAQGRVSRMTKRVERCLPPGGPPQGLWAKERTASTRVPTSPPPPTPSPREPKPSEGPASWRPQRLSPRRSQVNTPYYEGSTLTKLRNIPLRLPVLSDLRICVLFSLFMENVPNISLLLSLTTPFSPSSMQTCRR